MGAPAEQPGKNNYEVGYGRPPKHTRFQKGQSGNPKGRTKGSGSIQLDILATLNRKVFMQLDGRQARLSIVQAMTLSSVNQALKGDARAQAIVLKLMDFAARQTAVDPKQERPSSGLQLTPEEEAFIAAELEVLGLGLGERS